MYYETPTEPAWYETQKCTKALINALSAMGASPRTEVRVVSPKITHKKYGRIDVFVQEEDDSYVFEIKMLRQDLCHSRNGKNFFGNHNYLVVARNTDIECADLEWFESQEEYKHVGIWIYDDVRKRFRVWKNATRIETEAVFQPKAADDYFV